MGMNMAGQAGGMNAQNLYQMGAQQQAAQPAPAPAAAEGWNCSCGQSGITGKFCPNCGSKKPEPKACRRKLEMPAVRRDGKRKILPGMRHQKAGIAGKRLDV